MFLYGKINVLFFQIKIHSTIYSFILSDIYIYYINIRYYYIALPKCNYFSIVVHALLSQVILSMIISNTKLQVIKIVLCPRKLLFLLPFIVRRKTSKINITIYIFVQHKNAIIMVFLPCSALAPFFSPPSEGSKEGDV